MIKSVGSTAITIGVLALAGCGGGGGDDAPAVSPAAITTDNAPTIASSVMSASQEGDDLGSLAFFGAGGAPMSASKSIQAYSTVRQIQSSQIDALVKHAQSFPQAAIGPETTPCTNGGSVTVSGNVSGAGTLSPNDTIVFDFQACVEAEATINGRFSMRITSFNGDLESGTFSFGVNVEVTSFQITVDGETATLNGSFTLTVNATASSTLTTSVTSTSFTVTEGGATHTLSNYSSTRVLTTGAFTHDMGGTLTSSAFSGSVTFDTTTLLQGTEGDFAYMGQVLITGANGGTIKIIVLDATFVRLEVDVNGDGILEASIDQTWDDLI